MGETIGQMIHGTVEVAADLEMSERGGKGKGFFVFQFGVVVIEGEMGDGGGEGKGKIVH